MIKFTKEEINLCGQVAKKQKKEIKARQYFYNNHLKRVQWSEHRQPKAKWAIPLWTISDCLEFLRENDWYISMLYEYIGKKEGYDLDIGKLMKNTRNPEGTFEHFIAKTFLEICLKAVLAVIEDWGCIAK